MSDCELHDTWSFTHSRLSHFFVQNASVHARMLLLYLSPSLCRADLWRRALSAPISTSLLLSLCPICLHCVASQNCLMCTLHTQEQPSCSHGAVTSLTPRRKRKARASAQSHCSTGPIGCFCRHYPGGTLFSWSPYIMCWSSQSYQWLLHPSCHPGQPTPPPPSPFPLLWTQKHM